MSIDLHVGFKNPVENLDDVMASQGFMPLKSSKEEADGIAIKMYTFAGTEKSGKGVTFSYHDTSYRDSVWAELRCKVVAEGIITLHGKNNEHIQKLNKFTRFLMEQYGALLYDPQSRRARIPALMPLLQA